MSGNDKKASSDNPVTVVKNATDLQRLKLEKLMKNTEKLAFIPDKPKEKKFSDPAEFVRNVMGSSAGAGSGEFHVYRHIRRREYARQEFLNQMKDKDALDVEYHYKIEDNRAAAESKTAKKRAKRQRQKEKQKAKRQKLKEMKKKGISTEVKSSSSESSSEDEEEEEEKEGEKGKDEQESRDEKQEDAKESIQNINVKSGNDKQREDTENEEVERTDEESNK